MGSWAQGLLALTPHLAKRRTSLLAAAFGLKQTNQSMQNLRAAAAALPVGEPLTWSRASAENADELADWTVKIGSAHYKVHSAVIASGPRCSEKIRAQVIEATKSAGVRSTDLLSLVSSEPARAAIQKDPHSGPTVEVLLSWIYGHGSDFSLPSLGGTPVAAPAAMSMAGAMGGATAAVANGDAGTVYDMFSTAIFGTPSKGNGSAAASAPPTPSSVAKAPPSASKAPAVPALATGGGLQLVLKAEQLPLMWQLADALGVHGLKAKLTPVFEHHALPASFVMETAGFERLKLLVRALELHADEIIGALCEQLRLQTQSTAALRTGMAELAVAAAAVDSGRYEALVACGLLPAADAAKLGAILDKPTLRVSNEAQVHDLLIAHFKHAKTPPAAQEALWATCRFTFLPADRLVQLSERPNVPARWLALACAQRAAAASGSGSVPLATQGEAAAAQTARLKARDFYRALA